MSIALSLCPTAWPTTGTPTPLTIVPLSGSSATTSAVKPRALDGVVGDASTWQAGFETLLPGVERHAKARFASTRSSTEREELTSETVAAACLFFRRLWQTGGMARAYAGTLCSYAARHAAQGRHVGGSLSSRDAMSRLAMRRRGFSTGSLQALANGGADLAARGVTPAEAAVAALTFREWLGQRTDRERRAVALLASGEPAKDVAAALGVSPSRLSQIRLSLCESWERYNAG